MSNTAVDNFFLKDGVIDFLLNESQKNRIYPVGPLFGETRFAAFGIESVGGYHPAKLKNYNGLLEKTGNLASIPILRMMNVKYLISSQKINHPDLQFLNRLSLKQSRSLIDVNIYPNPVNDILNLRSNTFKFTKSQLAIWKSQDKLRELKNSHIMTLIASER